MWQCIGRIQCHAGRALWWHHCYLPPLHCHPLLGWGEGLGRCCLWVVTPLTFFFFQCVHNDLSWTACSVALLSAVDTCLLSISHFYRSILGFPCGSAGKESACNAGSIRGLGRSPGEGKGYPLQYSGLENSVDWIVHGVCKESDRTERLSFSLS